MLNFPACVAVRVSPVAKLWYLSREWCWPRGGASGMAGRVRKRLAGLKCHLLLLSHNLLCGWKAQSGTLLMSTISIACNINTEHRQQHSLTLWKHAVHIEPVGGAGLIKQRVTHINAELSGSLILNHAWVTATDFIWETHRDPDTFQTSSRWVK